jgi:hypothetical protein
MIDLPNPLWTKYLTLHPAAKWLAALLCIQEILGYKSEPETGYSEIFHSLPQFLQANSSIVTLKYFMPTSKSKCLETNDRKLFLGFY